MIGNRGIRYAWLLAWLPAVAACHNNSSPGKPKPDGSTMYTTVTDGSVRVTIGANDCPTVTVVAGPAVARVGGHVSVTAKGTDDDPNSQLTYAWSAAAGSFASANAMSTTYTCPPAGQAGPQPLTVTVSDGKCSVMGGVTISCDALVSDAGSGDTSVASDAGNGGSAGTPGGTGGSGGAGGTGAGGSVGGAGGSCADSDPSKCEGTACNQCTFGMADGEADLCDSAPQGCFNCDLATMGCSVSTLTSDLDRTKCNALYLCVRDKQCAKDGDPQPCFCGTTDLTLCQTGAMPPNGVCLQQFLDAAKSSAVSDVFARFIDPKYPIGAAMNLAICRGTFCGHTGTDSAHPNANPACPLW
jgi:hypothetical protein